MVKHVLKTISESNMSDKIKMPLSLLNFVWGLLLLAVSMMLGAAYLRGETMEALKNLKLTQDEHGKAIAMHATSIHRIDSESQGVKYLTVRVGELKSELEAVKDAANRLSLICERLTVQIETLKK